MSATPADKRIGFLSFGAWHPGGGLTLTGGEALRQTVELAVAAEELGIDGAFVRVHHLARQLSSPFPLLAAIGVKTSRIEIGTGVIDMRYESALAMAENAAAADLLAGGRLQLGVSRGSPEPAWRGAGEAFGYIADAEDAREKTALFRTAIAGAGVVRADAGGQPGSAMLAVQPQSPGLADRIWWGSGSRETAIWAGEQGMNLMSPTLLLEDTRVPFDQLQAEQIALFRDAWSKAGHARDPRVSVSRSVMPITSDLDRRLFSGDANEDQVGWLDGALSRFGRSYTGEPDRIAEEFAADAAVQAADKSTVLDGPAASWVSTTTPRCSRPSRAISRPRSAGHPRISPSASDNASGAAHPGVRLSTDPSYPCGFERSPSLPSHLRCGRVRRRARRPFRRVGGDHGHLTAL